MSEEKPNVPKLRFPGFADPWEQRKFSDLFSYERPDAYIVNNDEYDDSNPTPVLTANKGFILGYTAETRTHEGPCVIFDDFTLDCKLVTFPFMVKSSAMKILHCHDGVDLTFAYERLCSAKIEALGHARHYISVVQNTESAIPSYEEQSAIGRVLSNLDTLITLHQRKLDHLKEMKKGLLQKMFPKNGESIPELRFPGFADPWEQRKFSEIATLRRGLTYSPNDITDKNGGVRVLRSSNISGDQFELHDDDVFVREDAVKIAPAEDGDILITAANGSSNLVGKRARICNLPGKTVHGGFMLLASTGDSYYLNAAMGAQWYRRFLHMGVAGGNGALGNLDMKALLDYELLTPSRNERKKIGSLFNRLDSLITLHQRKLDHLKQMKKGLLQQMFV